MIHVAARAGHSVGTRESGRGRVRIHLQSSFELHHDIAEHNTKSDQQHGNTTNTPWSEAIGKVRVLGIVIRTGGSGLRPLSSRGRPAQIHLPARSTGWALGSDWRSRSGQERPRTTQGERLILSGEL